MKNNEGIYKKEHASIQTSAMSINAGHMGDLNQADEAKDWEEYSKEYSELKTTLHDEKLQAAA